MGPTQASGLMCTATTSWCPWWTLWPKPLLLLRRWWVRRSSAPWPGLCARPPALLTHHGVLRSRLPRFIAAFPPAASVPYLADVARLEMARVRAYHAADAAPIDAAMLQAALGNPAEQRCLQLALHPSVQVVSSDFAVGDIWTAHHEPLDSGGFDPDLPQHVMVFRNRLHVDMLLLCAGDAHWVSALQNRHTLLNATVSACSAWPDFDLPRCLATLLRLQLFTPLFTPDECHEPVH
jgi:hypothetical protein